MNHRLGTCQLVIHTLRCEKKSDTFFWCIVGLKIETCSVSMLFFWWGYGYMGLSLFQTSNVFMFFSKNVALPTTAAYANKNHLGCDEVGNNRFAWKPFGFFSGWFRQIGSKVVRHTHTDFHQSPRSTKHASRFTNKIIYCFKNS